MANKKKTGKKKPSVKTSVKKKVTARAKPKVQAKTKTKAKTKAKTKTAKAKPQATAKKIKTAGQVSVAKAGKKTSPKRPPAKKTGAKAATRTTSKQTAAVPKKSGAKAVKATGSRRGTFWNNLFTPLDDRIVIQPVGASERTAGGLYIPGTVRDRPQTGEVLLVGRGRKNKKGKIRPMDVRVGDQVLFKEHTGTELNIAGNEALLLREEDLLGVLTR